MADTLSTESLLLQVLSALNFPTNSALAGTWLTLISPAPVLLF